MPRGKLCDEASYAKAMGVPPGPKVVSRSDTDRLDGESEAFEDGKTMNANHNACSNRRLANPNKKVPTLTTANRIHQRPTWTRVRGTCT